MSTNVAPKWGRAAMIALCEIEVKRGVGDPFVDRLEATVEAVGAVLGYPEVTMRLLVETAALLKALGRDEA